MRFCSNSNSFEGPIDVLLALARDQKVDLTQISILQLARQYLAFIDRAQQLSLDVAAEYLVMAAWLAYLKSNAFARRKNEDEPSAEMMARLLSNYGAWKRFRQWPENCAVGCVCSLPFTDAVNAKSSRAGAR